MRGPVCFDKQSGCHTNKGAAVAAAIKRVITAQNFILGGRIFLYYNECINLMREVASLPETFCNRVLEEEEEKNEVASA